MPIDERRFIASNRIRASHVLLLDNDDRPMLSNGVGTYRSINAAGVAALSLSLIAGVLGLLYVLICGAVRIVGSAHRFVTSPLAFPFLVALGLPTSTMFFLNQHWSKTCDVTIASVLLAATTILLPIATAVALFRARTQTISRMEISAYAAVLQWFAVLAYGGLAPSFRDSPLNRI